MINLASKDDQHLFSFKKWEMGLNNDTYLKNQSKSPPPKPKSSYSYLGYSFLG